MSEDAVATLRLWWGYARRIGPWWLLGSGVSVAVLGSLDRAPSLLWSDLASVVTVVIVAGFVWIGLARGMGYRLGAAGDLGATELVHFSWRTPQDLLDPADQIHLPSRCTLRSRLLRANRPWAHPQHAVYFFVGYPSPARLRAMVSTMSASTVVTIAVDDIDGPLLVRWDGCAALPEGYGGPGRVESWTAPQKGEEARR